MPDGEIKSYTKHVIECPTWEAVQQMHVPKVDSGDNRLGCYVPRA